MTSTVGEGFVVSSAERWGWGGKYEGSVLP